jgi:hypothetical protein
MHIIGKKDIVIDSVRTYKKMKVMLFIQSYYVKFWNVLFCASLATECSVYYYIRNIIIINGN